MYLRACDAPSMASRILVALRVRCVRQWGSRSTGGLPPDSNLSADGSTYQGSPRSHSARRTESSTPRPEVGWSRQRRGLRCRRANPVLAATTRRACPRRPRRTLARSRARRLRLRLGSSPAIGRAKRSAAPRGRPRVSRSLAQMLLNALTTERPSVSATPGAAGAPMRPATYRRFGARSRT